MTLNEAYRKLQFCPICGLALTLHAVLGTKSCFLHGDFYVSEKNGKVIVEFKMTAW